MARELPRIVILHSGFPKRTPIHLLFEALARLGYENGRTATIDLLGGEGEPDRLKALVAQIGLQKPDVIIAITSPAVVALKDAGLTIPVVFAFVPDPIALGVVESLARPGRNFTGVTYSESGLAGKRFELLLDAIAGTKKLAVFWNPAFPGHADAVENIRASALTRDIEIFSRQLKGLEDLEPAFDDAVRAKARAAVFMADNLMFGNRKQVAELAIKYQLPTIHSFPPEVRDGGLMFYGPSNDENYQRCAALADRILKGAGAGELPVEQPTKFELIINLKTASALGLTIPESFLLRADEVIE
jgi:putative ABC transport system substrate-binding protein